MTMAVPVATGIKATTLITTKINITTAKAVLPLAKASFRYTSAGAMSAIANIECHCH